MSADAQREQQLVGQILTDRRVGFTVTAHLADHVAGYFFRWHAALAKSCEDLGHAAALDFRKHDIAWPVR